MFLECLGVSELRLRLGDRVVIAVVSVEGLGVVLGVCSPA